jgi:hypothetical protein
MNAKEVEEAAVEVVADGRGRKRMKMMMTMMMKMIVDH